MHHRRWLQPRGFKLSRTASLSCEVLEVRQLLSASPPLAASMSAGVEQSGYLVGPEFTVNDQEIGSLQFSAPAIAVDASGSFAIAYPHPSPTAAPLALLRSFDADGLPLGPSTGFNKLLDAHSSVHDVQALGEDAYLILSTQSTRYSTLEAVGPTGHSSGTILDLGSVGPNTRAVRFATGETTLVIWEQVVATVGRHLLTSIHAQRFDTEGIALGEAIEINPTVPGVYGTVDFAINASGDYVVSWNGRVDTDANVFARRFAADDTALTGEITVGGPESVFGRQSVAMAGSGEFTVVWDGSGVLMPGVYRRRFAADGEPLGAAERLNSEITSGGSPTIDMDAAGRSIVAWNGGPRGWQGIGAQVFDARGDALGGPFQVSTSPLFLGTDGSIYPEVAMNDSGEAVVAWYQDGIGAEVKARRLSLDALPHLDLSGAAEGTNYEATFNQTHLLPNSAAITDIDAFIVSQTPTLVGSAVTIVGALAGDVLLVDTTGTNVASQYAAGVLTLSGVDSVAHYEQVLRSLALRSSAIRPDGSTIEIEFRVDDGTQVGPTATTRLEVRAWPEGTYAESRLFYNQSAWDGNSSAIDAAADDAAIAPDKRPYVPNGSTADFVSVSSYSRGINGVMIDVAASGVANVSAADFIFRVGSSNLPSTWAAAPQPQIAVIPGGGANGWDRIELVWPNGAIKNTWLEIQVLATANTRLIEPVVFYWGSRIGDSGTAPNSGFFQTHTTDAQQAMATLGRNKPIDDPRDYNRDGAVTTIDFQIAVANLGSIARLHLPLSLQPALPAAPMLADSEMQSTIASALAANPVPATRSDYLLEAIARRQIEEFRAQNEPRPAPGRATPPTVMQAAIGNPLASIPTRSTVAQGAAVNFDEELLDQLLGKRR